MSASKDPTPSPHKPSATGPSTQPGWATAATPDTGAGAGQSHDLAGLAQALLTGPRDHDSILATVGRICGAEAVGRGDPPPDAVVMPLDMWLLHPAWSPEALTAAMPIVEMAWALATKDQHIREQEAQYQALLEASFEGICLHDHGTLVEVNSAMTELYGYTRDEMLGMDISTLSTPGELTRVRELMDAGFSGVYETSVFHSTGEVLPLEVRGKDVTWRGRRARVVAVRDLRERKAVEAELVRARETAIKTVRAQSRFLATMSHEIRTPMNGVLGMAELLLEDGLNHDQNARAVVIRDSAANLLGLLNDILDLSQVEAGQLNLSKEPTVVKAVVAGALDTVRANAHATGLDLCMDMPAGLPRTWTLDPLRLRQVLVNLLGNAVRHTPKGQVTVRLAHRQNTLQFSVEDTGTGMPADVSARLFQRFSTGVTHGTKDGGTGLGLAISRELVLAMGGHIDVESTVGKGTSVRFTVTTEPITRPASGRIALLADDGEEARALAAALTRQGATVQTFAQPGAVLTAWAPGLVFGLTASPPAGPWRRALVDGLDNIDELPVVGRPVLAADLSALLDAAPSPPAVRQTTPTVLDVLLVEDNPINQLVVREQLHRCGAEVTVADHGRAAIEAVAKAHFDLILMDIQMPEMDGLDATRALRRTGCTVPIFALSASAMKGDAAESRAAGMNGHLAKPIRLADLQALVQDIRATVDRARLSPTD